MTDPNTGEPEHLDELTAAERGFWRVATRDSQHLFDLDRQFVIRIPGPNAEAGINDRLRPLRTIERCEVGKRGFWTMHTDSFSFEIDYYWHRTSRVHRIERISKREFDRLRHGGPGSDAGVSPQPGDAGAEDTDGVSEDVIASYAHAAAEWAESGDEAAWDAVVGDGLEAQADDRELSDPDDGPQGTLPGTEHTAPATGKTEH